MKKVFLAIAILSLLGATGAMAQQVKKQQVDKELYAEATRIVEALRVDQSKEKSVYNVLYHVQTRIEDLKLGTPNYDKLLGYINEERAEMMKVILPEVKYKEYDKLYSSAEGSKIQQLKSKNENFVKNSTNKEAQEKANSALLMQKDQEMAERDY